MTTLILGAIVVAAGLGFGVELMWVMGLFAIANGLGRFFSKPTERVRQCPICQPLCKESPAAGNPTPNPDAQQE